MAQCILFGIDSGAVHAPESNNMGIISKITSILTCPKLRLIVAMNKPIPDVVKTYKADTAKKRLMLPLTGKLKAGIMIRNKLTAMPKRITSPMDITLGSKICRELNGDTVSCSMVPRSFSRTAAAAGNIIDKMVIALNISMIDINQLSIRLGL